MLKALSENDPRYSSLEHLYNVVVFPSRGSRPEQQKMSGGDLDGDVYLVIWEESMVNGLKTPEGQYKIAKPACYKKFKEDKVELTEIEDNIKRYFEKDNLGHLSNLHLALCDQLGPMGPYSEDAEELSRLIGIAVDFAKHGKCVGPELYQHIESKL